MRTDLHTAIGVLTAVLVSGCVSSTGTTPATAGTDRRLANIEQRIAASEQRLEQVQAEVSASEERARQARQTAEIEQCKAQNSQIQARASAYRAECMQQVAAYNACEAKNSEARADGTLAGCFFGIGLASIVTGGLAVPLALGGCAAGRAMGRGRQCAQPRCVADFGQAEKRALHELRLAEPPMCGGYAGLSVKNEYVTKRAGVIVTQVGGGSTAESLGLASGDVLLGLQGRSISSDRDVQAVLARARVGSKVRANVVRDHARISVVGKARDMGLDGRRSPGRVQLGAAFRGPAKVRYSDAVRVVRVESSAEAAGLSVGTVIRGVGGQLIRDRSELRSALMSTPPGSSVTFQVMRGGRVERIDVPLEERRGRSGI